MLKVTKLRTTGKYAVIDTTFGIKFVYTANTRKQCVSWCKTQGYEYLIGFEY